MLDFAEALADAGSRAIAVSRFGYLRTPMPEAPSPETQADAYACLLDRLGVSDVVAFGASAGAPSTMQFCLRHIDRCSGMVLLVPVAFAEGRAAEDTVPPSPFMGFVLRHVLSSDFVIWAITRAAPGMLVETVLATPKSEFAQADATAKARALDIIRGIFPVTPKLEGIAHDSALGPVVPRYALEDISAPTLVISVENDLYDTYAGALYTATHTPHARFVGFPSGGHGWLGHHREVLEIIIGFVREHAPQNTAIGSDAGVANRPDCASLG